MADRPEITSYSDYRDFLRDLFSFEKARRKPFSFQYCAKRLGTSKSYLKLVIEKRRQISMAKVSLIWKLFRLNEFEQQYFTLLFLRATADDARLEKHFDLILNRLKLRIQYAGAHEQRQSAPEKEAVFQSWLYMVIHSMARLEGFLPDVEWIRGKLAGVPVDPEVIRHALDELLKNGSLREKNGRWAPDEFVFRTPDDFDGDQFKIYKIGIQRADEVLDDVRPHFPAHFHMMTVSLNEKDREAVFKLYLELRDRIIEISKASKDPTRVLFVSNNIFSATRVT